MNEESLNKLDDSFSQMRKMDVIDPGVAMQLLNSAVRGASTEENEELAKCRVQRLYGFSLELKKAFSEETEDNGSIKLPLEVLNAIRKDVENDPENIVPISTAMKAINKRFGKKEEPQNNEPVEKRVEDEKVSASSVFTGLDLNAEDFDPNTVDWGRDPEWK